MIFMREDKITSSKHMKYELGVSKDQIQNPIRIIWVFQIIFFSKNKIWKIGQHDSLQQKIGEK